MAGIDANVTTRGFGELAAIAGGIAGRIELPAGADGTVTGLMRSRLQQRFDREGEGDWPALAASTLARKQRRGQDSRIMRATGQMLRDLLAGKAEATAGQIRFTATLPPHPGEHPKARYPHALTVVRPLLSGNEQTLAGQLADALGDHMMGGA